MKNNKNSYLFVILFILLGTRGVCAESVSLKKIKSKMGNLALENYELKKDHESVARQLAALQEELNRKRKEVEVMVDRKMKKEQVFIKEKSTLKRFYKNMDVVQSDILIKKSKILFLKKKILEIEKDGDLFNLQLFDLKYQKKELQKKINADNSFSRNNIEHLTDKIIGLKLRIDEYSEKQKNLSQLIIEIEEKKMNSGVALREMKSQNERIKSQIQEIITKRELQDRINSNLKDKFSLRKKSMAEELNEKRKEYKMLSETVSREEEELSILKRKMKAALKWKKKKIKYKQEMVEIDRVNAEIRNKIAATKKTMENL